MGGVIVERYAMIWAMPRILRGAFFTHWGEFLQFAAEASANAKQVVAAEPKAWPMRDALGAILFSAIATEAFINDLAEAAAREADHAHDMQLPAAPVLADLAAVLNSVEDDRGGVQLKYHMARMACTGHAFDRGIAPFQDFDRLIRLRNLLVHPRHQDRTTSLGYIEPASDIIRDLQQRGLTQTRPRGQGDPPGGMSWLSQVYCDRTATWAHEAARDIIAELIRVLPYDDRLFYISFLRQWLSSSKG